MIIFLYNVIWFLFNIAVKLVAPFNTRAALLKKGHAKVWDDLKKIKSKGKVVWVHCASLGEFEQGRPLIEAIKEKKPEYKIVITFFSPSGYEVRKDYKYADLVLYLPPDTRRNARRFIESVNPKMAFFIKYEFWYYYFHALKKNEIPLYSVSAIFRENQMFFKWYGFWFRKLLKCVTKFYVQDEASGLLLNKIAITNYVVAGDTRFDRVSAIAESAAGVPLINSFVKGSRALVAGSTWPADEKILAAWINKAPSDVKLIIAPHEIDKAHINELIQRFNIPTLCITNITNELPSDTRVLIIDTIGMLSAIYRYGSIAYIGGGFGKGIHNILEAATYGMPVIFGPKYKKFREAVELEKRKGGFAIHTYEQFVKVMNELWSEDEKKLVKAGEIAAEYVESMKGATELILQETVMHN